jgi:anthranilate synthase component 2
MNRILLVDNYDSFTWNLWHAMAGFPETEIDVMFHDDARLGGNLDAYSKFVFSPGPGLPEEAGQMMHIISRYAGKIPMLGVCLGHQALALHYGAKLKNLERPLHGIQRICRVTNAEPLFKGLPAEFLVGHYHSWVVEEESLPPCLQVSARGVDDIVLAIRHTEDDSFGIQFHPESVMTPLGEDIIRNFLDI